MRVSLAILIFISTSVLALTPALAQDSPADWQEGYQRLAALGSGFLVWESNRTGDWRIWREELDGTGLRQLSPEEPDRDHYCPHLSPDGSRLVYESFPKDLNTYGDYRAGEPIPLHLLSSDGKSDRILAEDSRAYGEDRCAVWLDDSRLIYLDATRSTRLLNVDTGESRELARYPADNASLLRTAGWLINPTLTFATTGSPCFAPYNALTGQVTPRQWQNGCQPYLSRDGKWGFWMHKAGGPVGKLRLAAGEIGQIIGENDPRLPADRRYVFFPMVSADMKLFACAASKGQYDHFATDYEVFIAQLDPETVELVGKPVRYTFDPGCDRFPDVHLDSPEPDIRSDLTAPEVRCAWAQDDHTLIVTFSEPVYTGKLKVNLKPSLGLASAKLTGEAMRLVLKLKQPLISPVKLTLDKVTDLAQPQNKLAKTTLEVAPVVWPTSARDLVYLFETAETPNLVTDEATGQQVSYPLSPNGLARLDHDWWLLCMRGAWQIEGAGERLVEACKASNQLTLEAVLVPENATQGGPAPIVTLAGEDGKPVFTLGQEGESLGLRLRTGQEPGPALCFAKLSAWGLAHVVITYQPGRLAAFVNGAKELDLDNLEGGFDDWIPADLQFGGGWMGALSHVALYSRALSDEEALRESSYLPPKDEVAASTVRVRLLGRAEMPTLQTILPYRVALVKGDFEVMETLSGPPLSGKLCIAQWALLDGVQLAPVPTAPGEIAVLTLEPFEANPQLESVFQADKLEGNWDLPQYYDVNPNQL